MQTDAVHGSRTTRHFPRPVAGALRAVETYLLRGGGQRTARRNAWSAVCEDRRRAQDRIEAQSVLDSFRAGTADPKAL
ncbi:hypothetical protein GCM10027168_29320 [Streptomyces capparidis]